MSSRHLFAPPSTAPCFGTTKPGLNEKKITLSGRLSIERFSKATNFTRCVSIVHIPSSVERSERNGRAPTLFFNRKKLKAYKKYDTKKTDSSERIKSSALSCARTHSFGKRQPLSTQSRTTRAFEVNDMGESITRRTRAQRHASESLRHILPLGVRKGKNRIKCVPIFGVENNRLSLMGNVLSSPLPPCENDFFLRLRCFPTHRGAGDADEKGCEACRTVSSRPCPCARRCRSSTSTTLRRSGSGASCRRR